MKTLFRAEVKNIGKLANCQVEPLTKVNEKFYAIGFESDLDGEYGITDLNGYYIECKRDTRSINFEDMIDKNGVKIWISLNKSGSGSSIFAGLEHSYPNDKYILKYCLGIPFAYKVNSTQASRPFNMLDGCGWEAVNAPSYPTFEVTGIYEGKVT